MKTSEHTYFTLPMYDDKGDYTPSYIYILYHSTHDYDTHAIKLRSDIVIKKKVYPELKKLIQYVPIKRGDLRIIGFIFPAYSDGGICDVSGGVLNLYDEDNIEIRYCNPLLLFKEGDNRPHDFLTAWLDGDRKYTLLDYEEGELENEITKNMKKYNEWFSRYST